MRFATRLAVLVSIASPLAAPLAAQAPADTLDGARFFPLAVGNEWQHDHTTYGPFTVDEEWVGAWAVTADTVVEGRSYFVLETCSDRTGAPACDPVPTLLRYDDALASVFVWAEGEESPWFELPCPLAPLSDLPDTGPCFPSEAVYYETVPTYEVGGMDLDDVLVASYLTLASGTGLGYGIGLLAGYVGDPDPQHTWQLRYAKVDGTEVGTRGFTLPSASSLTPTAPAFTARIGPNPSPGPVQAAITGATPGPLRLDAFDLLGRRVATEFRTTNGEAALSLDLSGAAPGLYVVRVSDGERTLTRRVTVAR